MPIGAGGLRLGGGLGALALWGASAPLVSQETRPVGAPLRPLVADPSASTPAAAPALTIPPSCEQEGLGGRSASTGALPEPVGSQLSAAAQQAVTRIQAISVSTSIGSSCVVRSTSLSSSYMSCPPTSRNPGGVALARVLLARAESVHRRLGPERVSRCDGHQ